MGLNLCYSSTMQKVINSHVDGLMQRRSDSIVDLSDWSFSYIELIIWRYSYVQFLSKEITLVVLIYSETCLQRPPL